MVTVATRWVLLSEISVVPLNKRGDILVVFLAIGGPHSWELIKPTELSKPVMDTVFSFLASSSFPHRLKVFSAWV